MGVQGAKATISDVGTGRSAWGWKTTWSGGAEEWAFVKGGGAEDLQFVKEGHLVLKDAVCNGAEVLRLHDSGDIVFTDKAMGLSEPMVGEIMLVLASISIEREDSKWAWVWELLTW